MFQRRRPHARLERRTPKGDRRAIVTPGQHARCTSLRRCQGQFFARKRPYRRPHIKLELSHQTKGARTPVRFVPPHLPVPVRASSCQFVPVRASSPLTPSWLDTPHRLCCPAPPLLFSLAHRVFSRPGGRVRRACSGLSRRRAGAVPSHHHYKLRRMPARLPRADVHHRGRAIHVSSAAIKRRRVSSDTSFAYTCWFSSSASRCRTSPPSTLWVLQCLHVSQFCFMFRKHFDVFAQDLPRHQSNRKPSSVSINIAAPDSLVVIYEPKSRINRPRAPTDNAPRKRGDAAERHNSTVNNTRVARSTARLLPRSFPHFSAPM